MSNDLLMFAGEDNYSVTAFIKEASTIGVSKRVSGGMVPTVIPGVTRLFIAHMKARVITPHMLELLHFCLDWLIQNEDWLGEQPLYQKHLGSSMVALRSLLDVMAQEDPEMFQTAVNRYSVTFAPGVFGWTYLTEVQYVLPNDKTEEDTPAELKAAGVVPVHVEYEE